MRASLFCAFLSSVPSFALPCVWQDCTVRLWDINEASGCKALRKFSGHEGSVGVSQYQSSACA